MPLPIANTQYNELTGTVAIDTHSSMELSELLKSRGVDINRYLPIGISFSGAPPEDFTIYAVDVKITKPGFDNIADYAKEQDGEVPIVEFNFESSLDEFDKYFRRLEVCAFLNIPNMKSFHKIDSIDLH